MKKIYLDNAATTPMDYEVKKAMEPYFSDQFGNPSSLHYFGQQARKAVDESREKIAKTIGAGFREIIFTGSATEANSLAIRGIAKGIRNQELGTRKLRIITSAIEHESILETCKDLEREGVEIIYLPVDKNGIVNLKKLKESLNENTILVSIMYANNEIGVVQPIAEISKIIRNFREESVIKNNELSKIRNKRNWKLEIGNWKFATIYPLLHVDAVQAFQFLGCNVNELGVDLLTLSAHKIYGPKGTGLLYVRQNKEVGIKSKDLKGSSIIHNSSFIIPVITGGGQEFGLRSGTENVANIVGFAKALELADKNRDKELIRIAKLKTYFIKESKKVCPKVEINGFTIQDSRIKNKKILNPKSYILNLLTLPNILNIYFPGHKADDLLIKLDMNGVAVSSGSACASFASKPSHVLKALGYKENRIESSLRFSLGKFTTREEITKVLKILKSVL